MELVLMTIKLIFYLAIVLVMILGIYKLTGNQITELQKNKYIRVIERTQIGKDTSIQVVKVGNKGYVLVTSPHNTEKIEELALEEINELENNKKVLEKNVSERYINLYRKIKVKMLKEEDYEKEE